MRALFLLLSCVTQYTVLLASPTNDDPHNTSYSATPAAQNVLPDNALTRSLWQEVNSKPLTKLTAKEVDSYFAQIDKDRAYIHQSATPSTNGDLSAGQKCPPPPYHSSHHFIMPSSNTQNLFAFNGQPSYGKPATPYAAPVSQTTLHPVSPHGVLPSDPYLPDFDVLFGNKEPATETFTRKAYKRKADTDNNPVLKRLLTEANIYQGYKS